MMTDYAIKGRRKKAEPYQYTQCGLDDVYLLNGYRTHQTPYGNGISVENAEGLHKAIAEYVCLHKATLNGKEIRFLRKLLDLTQAELALCLGCDQQSVARWEKGKTINGAADKLIRLIYLASDRGNIDATELVKKMSALDAKLVERQVFELTSEEWKAAA
jgi:DNA-binding transcriptional regulator YiaG